MKKIYDSNTNNIATVLLCISIYESNYSGDSTMSTPGTASHAQHMFCRAISRTYTSVGGSNNPLTPTSSIATEEWRPIFEKLLEGAPPQIGTGKNVETIPLDRFREILEDDPLWSETIPKEMQERILSSVDKDGDGAIGNLKSRES